MFWGQHNLLNFNIRLYTVSFDLAFFGFYFSPWYDYHILVYMHLCVIKVFCTTKYPGRVIYCIEKLWIWRAYIVVKYTTFDHFRIFNRFVVRIRKKLTFFNDNPQFFSKICIVYIFKNDFCWKGFFSSSKLTEQESVKTWNQLKIAKQCVFQYPLNPPKYAFQYNITRLRYLAVFETTITLYRTSEYIVFQFT